MSLHLSPNMRVGVIHNPASTNADAVEIFQKELFHAGFRHEIIPTAPDIAGTEANIVAFDPTPADIFAIHTGDGGLYLAENAIANLGLKNLIIPCRGGKANDNAVSYYGDTSFFDILDNGQPARVHPLDVYVDTPGIPEQQWQFVGYAGWWGTAKAARALEPIRDEVKDLRGERREFAAKKQEALSSLDAVVSAPPIIAEYDGRERPVADVTFCGISRMAREIRVHADPFDNSYFRRLVTPAGGRIRIGNRMAMSKFGLIFGDKMAGNTEVILHSQAGEPIPMHINGEIALDGLMLEVASGSRVGADISLQYINTLRPAK